MYSMLDYAELKDGSGKVVHQLLKMRNPWGTENYSGPWSDSSSLWTPEWKKQVDLKVNNDGIFWMDFNFFYTNWDQASVAVLDKSMDANYQIKNLKDVQGVKKFKLKNPSKQKMEIVVDAGSDRLWPRSENCSPMIQANVCLFHVTGGQNKQVGCKLLTSEGFVGLGSGHIDLPAGDYSLHIDNMAMTANFDLSVQIWSNDAKVVWG